MNKNIKVAKQLIKLAKALIAFKEDETVQTDVIYINDINDVNKITSTYDIDKIDKNFWKQFDSYQKNEEETVDSDLLSRVIERICNVFNWAIDSQIYDETERSEIKQIFRIKIWNVLTNKNHLTRIRNKKQDQKIKQKYEYIIKNKNYNFSAEQPSGFFNTMLKNIIKNYYRLKRNEINKIEQPDEDNSIVDVIDKQTQRFNQSNSQEQYEVAEEILEKFKEKYKNKRYYYNIVVLFLMQDLSVKEICEEINSNDNYERKIIDTTVHNAIRAFKEFAHEQVRNLRNELQQEQEYKNRHWFSTNVFDNISKTSSVNENNVIDKVFQDKKFWNYYMSNHPEDKIYF